MKTRTNPHSRLRWLRRCAVLVAALCVFSWGAGSGSGQAALATGAEAMRTVDTIDRAGAAPGWPGGLASYQGRYQLVTSSDAHFARTGTLTIFGRMVPKVPKLQMSGILSLYTTNDTSLFYVTHFMRAGTKLSAQVNMGLYTGPEIGMLSLVSRHGSALVLRFLPLQGTSVTLNFRQISTNPHP